MNNRTPTIDELKRLPIVAGRATAMPKSDERVVTYAEMGNQATLVYRVHSRVAEGTRIVIFNITASGALEVVSEIDSRVPVTGGGVGETTNHELRCDGPFFHYVDRDDMDPKFKRMASK